MHFHSASTAVIGGLVAFVIYQLVMMVLEWQSSDEDDDDEW